MLVNSPIHPYVTVAQLAAMQSSNAGSRNSHTPVSKNSRCADPTSSWSRSRFTSSTALPFESSRLAGKKHTIQASNGSDHDFDGSDKDNGNSRSESDGDGDDDGDNIKITIPGEDPASDGEDEDGVWDLRGPPKPLDTGILLSLPKWAGPSGTVTCLKGIAGNNYKLYNEMGFTVGNRDHKLYYNRIRVCVGNFLLLSHSLILPLPSDLFVRTASVQSSTISSNFNIKILNCWVKSMQQSVLYP